MFAAADPGGKLPAKVKLPARPKVKKKLALLMLDKINKQEAA